MEILCVFNNSLLASRKICDRSSDNNLGAKTTWQKDVTQCAVYCHLVSYRKSVIYQLGEKWPSLQCFVHEFKCVDHKLDYKFSFVNDFQILNPDKYYRSILTLAEQMSLVLKTPKDAIQASEEHRQPVSWSAKPIIKSWAITNAIIIAYIDIWTGFNPGRSIC